MNRRRVPNRLGFIRNAGQAVNVVLGWGSTLPRGEADHFFDKGLKGGEAANDDAERQFDAVSSRNVKYMMFVEIRGKSNENETYVFQIMKSITEYVISLSCRAPGVYTVLRMPATLVLQGLCQRSDYEVVSELSYK